MNRVSASNETSRNRVKHKMDCETLIDPQPAADLLGIHVTTLKAMAAKGGIPGMKIGNRWKFRASALDEWIRRQLQSSGCSRPGGE